MKRASDKDIIRTIWKEKKRFFSIMMITILGVTIMTGLIAGCKDLRYTADRFYDQQNLFDISILSTLGLTGDDVLAIQAIEGIKKAEGSYSEVVHTKKGDINKTAEIKVMYDGGLNVPYLVEGTLPQNADEIAVTSNYIEETGKQIGDLLVIEEILDSDSTGNFPNTTFTITGIIIDVMDINNAEGSVAFRATPNADYTFFVTPEAVDSDIYTAVYASLEGTEELLCYSDAYEDMTASVISLIEADIMEQRQQARYQEITGKAYEKIAEKEEEMYQEFEEIEEEFADAGKEIKDGWKELADGKQELTDKEQEVKAEIADARKELEDAYTKLNDGWQQLNDAEKELNIGAAKLEEGKEQLRLKEEEANKQLEEALLLLNNKISDNETKRQTVEEGLTNLKQLFGSDWPETEWNTYVGAIQAVVAPIIASQMNSQSPVDESTLQGQILAAITADSGVQTAAGAFGTAIIPKLGTVIATLYAQKLSTTDPTIIAILDQQIAYYYACQTPGTSEQQDFLQSKLPSLAIGNATCNATTVVLDAAMAEFNQQKEYAMSQIAAGHAQLEAAERELEDGRAQLEAGRTEVKENYDKWKEGLAELDDNEREALETFAEEWGKIADGEQELLDGEKELEENRVEFEEEKAKAEDKIAEAKDEVAKIDMTKWYVQDRTSLSGYVNVKSDTECIESLATVFAVVFFIVAILISLTTVTRMVEEERGLVGTYKALGFTDHEIRSKYVIYALAASLLGSILGDIGGFVVLPEILFVFFKVMYLFPAYYLQFEAVSGTVSGILFMIGIVGAAIAACHTELKQLPAQLMRPKAPKMGSRVLLERITFIWKRMSFLNKVTARNLFRYKKRLLMTLFGIMGCTALVLFGLAIKDSVAELMPLQYETVYKYDLLAATGSEDNDKLLEYMDTNSQITEYINIRVETVKLKNHNKDTEKVQLMVFPQGESITEYLTLMNPKEEPVEIGDRGIYLTENAASILGLEEGDAVLLQNLDLKQKETEITQLVRNYLGNNIYMSQNAYEELFGEYEPNGVLANLADGCTDQIGFCDTLSEEDWVLSAVSTQELKEGFSAAFTLINIVVYVVLILAAGLAFVVLFTLASINISERIRELATIKVLGFYDREVHLYVNKETLILTALGILLGLPVGAALSSCLTEILKMPSIYFAVTIYPRSFLLAAGISFFFALIVQFLTDRSLDVIDPVEALKSVE